MKTKADLLGELSELAEQHKVELPAGLKGFSYPAVEELLGKLLAQVASAATEAAPAGGASPVAPEAPVTSAAPAPVTPSPDAPAASETPAAGATTTAVEQPPAPPTEQSPPPAASGNEQAVPPAPLKLPPGHKRPTVREFVKAGYKAETYEAHMAEWEAEIAAKFANVPRYVVAPGRSLCGARGMLGPGAPVREDDFTGESKLEDFVRAGYVVAEA